MSISSKITLTGACFVAIGVVSYVHLKQISDRQKLHEGVVKDIERQQRRKIENIYILQQQEELTKQLKKQLADEQMQQEKG